MALLDREEAQWKEEREQGGLKERGEGGTATPGGAWRVV